MDDSLRRRLRELGVAKGLAGLASGGKSRAGRPTGARDHVSSELAPARSAGVVSELPGAETAVDSGIFWLDQRQYAAETCHGRHSLSRLADVSEGALELLGVPDLGPRPAFLDTETTGLAGGSGTLAFLVGVGVWSGESLNLHLIFMRDPGEEPAALQYLTQVLADATGLVTFNGRGFDVPLLETRYVMNRMVPAVLDRPHLDLLTTARQLWRDHLPSRRLGALETEILDVTRTEQDLDSGLIPYLYREYLETGDPSQMVRVIYHNEIDVLSLASLLVHVSDMVLKPTEMSLAAAEWVGVGRVYDRAGREEQAFEAWRTALAGDLEEACAARLWQELGKRYKRRGAWSDALDVWDAWSAAYPGAVFPLVEKAKYYEWTTRDLHAALVCTESAIERAGRLPSGLSRYRVLSELDHRLQRLQKRLSRLAESESAES